MMAVQNEITQTRLQVLSSREGAAKIAEGKYVLSPNINITTEKITKRFDSINSVEIDLIEQSHD